MSVTGAELGIVLAFVGGIVSFASPCFLPLLPAYVGYVVGTSAESDRNRRRRGLSHALTFVLGFSLVFVGLWAAIALAGSLLGDAFALVRQAVGAVIVVLGLHVAGVLVLPALARERRLPIGPFARGRLASPLAASSDRSVDAGRTAGHRRSFVLGVAFAAGWTPCIGPILGGILGVASLNASFVQGTFLLAAYAAGLAVPFLLTALGATAIAARLRRLEAHARAVSLASGGMLVAVGLLMATNTFGRLSGVLGPFGG